MPRTDDLRIREMKELLPPSHLIRELACSEKAATTAADARTRFSATLAESCAVIADVSPERLLEVIDPQPNGTWRHLPILEAIYQVVGHVQQHMAQIVVLTKQQLHRDLDLTMPRKR